ncbi:MAG: amidohydrolase, partial [Bacteroidia bacterium]|nr:amidohydrolase [Bacteroidia bacterium]
MKRILLFTMGILMGCTLWAQETFPVNGVQDQRSQAIALTNATICVDHETIIENATLLIKGDKIVSVGSGVRVPSSAVSYDMEGAYIFPSFIDIHTHYGMPVPK